MKPLLWLSIAVSFSSVSWGAALPSFHLPSGRLACSYSPTGEVGPQAAEQLECEVQNPSYKAPPRPQPAAPEQQGMPYADRLMLTATGQARWMYHGDTLLMPLAAYTDPALAYGQSWRKGAFSCTASVVGVHCVNHAGHGFDLGRHAYRLF